MKFTWSMTEENWKNLKNDHAQKEDGNFNNGAGFYGNCRIGNLCADIQHTLDEYNWSAYVNVFGLGIDDGYGETFEGNIPYALLDCDFKIPMKCKTFENFKKAFEKNFEEAINANEYYKELADAPLGNWN